MKKYAVCLLALISALPAMAELKNGPYIAVRVADDVATVEYSNEDKRKNAFTWMAALGMRLKDIRLEFEWTSVGNLSTDDVKVSQQRYMLQTYYDIPVKGAIRPFINAGLGATSHDVKERHTKNHDSKDKTTFTWALGAGLGININSRTSVDLGYRYVDMGKADVFDNDLKTKAHEIYMGLRFVF